MSQPLRYGCTLTVTNNSGSGSAPPATSYRHVRSTLVDRTKQIADGILLDLDDDGAVVGVETVGEYGTAEILAAVLDKARFA